LAVILRTPLEAAEMVKVRFGHAIPERLTEAQLESVDVAGFGDEGPCMIPRDYIAQVLEARVIEILRLIQTEVKRSGYEGLLPAGVVLCGGTTQLPGFRELARHVLDTPVRIGSPQDLSGLSDSVSGPAYATSVGLLHWGLRHSERVAIHSNGHGPMESGALVNRFLNWVRRAFFPQRVGS
jgi:cell division protein FtsA